MAIEFDEKGKYFTEFIAKDVILSRIQTHTHLIQGNIHVRKGERLSDEINTANNFLAVTQAELFDANGKTLYASDFLAVNRSHIIWLMPIEERKERSEK